MEIKVCKACGFILDTRPNMKSENGIKWYMFILFK